MKIHEVRRASRWIHIGAAGWFGTVTYSPLAHAGWALDVSAFGVFPLLVVTGTLMWKPRLLGGKS